MKMKTPLLLILSQLILGVFVLSTVQAIDFELQQGDSWAVDGGVFRTDKLPLNLDQLKARQLIVKNADGSLRVVKLDKGRGEPEVDQTLWVDRTAPVIEVQWHNTLQDSTGITIGPNSHVTLSVDEGTIQEVTVDDEVSAVDANSYVHHFSQASKEISVVADDVFKNTGSLTASLKVDFVPPELNWQLVAPAVLINNQWFGGRTAGVLLSASDDSGVDHYLLNDKKFNYNEEPVAVVLGDDIKVVDTLGNIKTETISWQQDTQVPYIIVNTKGQQFTQAEYVNVAMNETFEVLTADEGVGLQSQKYKSKQNGWLDLPKKFRFTNKGNYRIRVMSVDRVGNRLEQVVKVKVKR